VIADQAGKDTIVMKEVLVGVDRSDASRRAVNFAASMCCTLDRHLVIAHVIPWSPYSFNTPTENEERPVRKAAELKAAGEQVVDPLAELARQTDGVTLDVVLKHGQPVDTLLDLVEDRPTITHIVLGRTGDSVLRQAVFGGLPIRLIHHTRVPVTVVP
jgi:nucleotide-binding universal stress UspA family protein